MNIEQFREYCLSLPHTEEGMPFGEDIVVFKLNGKMFALLSIGEGEKRCNLKCDPERAIELREEYSGIIPGYHMNKKHWNSIIFKSDVSDSLLLELINHSYDLILRSFSKKVQKELEL